MNSSAKHCVPIQMRDKAYHLCRNYLSGEWKKISSSDMVFKTISGGLSNLLFYCSLPSTHTPLNGEPSQVLLRMYGQLHDGNDSNKVTDSVITMLLSERKLGPKLYGIFPGGRLEEYIPARAMTCQELKNPLYAATIARKLATVHTLDVPINKEPTWLFETMHRWLDHIRKNIDIESIPSSKKTLAQELFTFNFEAELTWLKEFLSLCQSPTVFSHNDLQEGNILLPNDASAKMYPFDDRVVFIDFEFCSYNYRGFDLGNHFCEWMFDYSNPEWPHYYENLHAYPDDAAKRLFIREYMKQSRIEGAVDGHFNEDHLIKEADCFALASHMLWTLWSINNAPSSKIEFGYWEYGKTRLNAYSFYKDHVLKTYCANGQ